VAISRIPWQLRETNKTDLEMSIVKEEEEEREESI